MSIRFAVLFMPKQSGKGKDHAADCHKQIKTHAAAEQHGIMQGGSGEHRAEQQQETAFAGSHSAGQRQR